MRSKPLLGTFVEILVDIDHSAHMSEAAVHQAINNAYQIIEDVQKMMSFHDAKSELSLLNVTAYRKKVEVHPWLYQVLYRAQKIYKLSQGLFDCTVASRLIQFEYLPSHAENKKSVIAQSAIQLLANNQVRFLQPIMVDLGGIAKGFAVDLAIHYLKKCGIQQAVVNAGGDLRVLGTVAEKIYVRNPKQPVETKFIGELSNGAIATSASYFTEKEYKEKKVSHLIHPLTGRAIVGNMSFSVIASSAWLADALTKVVAVSLDTHHPCLARFGAHAILIESF
ncbi:FAD:protein FMN transferase [Acinetobacter nectaris]|uniref:FAD:protein FMN transferase n=1 Tax=Acinetobacter nectaris TaxID=1219382 RepID=UPI001F44C079|nr:FAD:protein FMN transferase [Acinetobacter nectaris]MCF8998217.1 FAD:protein FMN transferase [Acinetobacter nectaris]MCF9026857.1 FAD:protein FMN transferase [Acinetobacter nectaris]